jgi:hypothetical protein
MDGGTKAMSDSGRTSRDDLSYEEQTGWDLAMAEVEEPVAIVRDLATTDPLDSTGGCAHCGATLLHQPEPDPRHHDSCLWRRAVEWVRDQETKA